MDRNVFQRLMTTGAVVFVGVLVLSVLVSIGVSLIDFSESTQ